MLTAGEVQSVNVKVAKLMNFEATMGKLNRDVEKLMVISAQHGMKLKELIVTAANSVSQVEFMAAITTTRFQNLNVVQTMKLGDKPAEEATKPQNASSAANDEEVKALKFQVSQLESELFNQNFKSDMEKKKMETELKIRQKEVAEVKSHIRQLELKLEKFAEAVEAGGISTNVHFSHPPTPAPSTPGVTTPSGRRQSLFSFTGEFDDSTVGTSRPATTPAAAANLGDIPEFSDDLVNEEDSSLHEEAEDDKPVIVQDQPNGNIVQPSSEVQVQQPPLDQPAAVASPFAHRMSIAMPNSLTPGALARRKASTVDVPSQAPVAFQQQYLPAMASVPTNELQTMVDVEELSMFIFGQISCMRYVEDLAKNISNQAISSAISRDTAKAEEEAKELVRMAMESRQRESSAQTDEVMISSSQGKRYSLKLEKKKSSFVSNSFMNNFNSDKPLDVVGALQDFQAKNQIYAPQEEGEVVMSEKKKRQSIRRSVRKDRASLIVKMNPEPATEAPLDLHSNNGSYVMPPLSNKALSRQPIQVVDTVPFSTDNAEPAHPRSARTSPRNSIAMSTGFFPPPGSAHLEYSDSFISTTDQPTRRSVEFNRNDSAHMASQPRLLIAAPSQHFPRSQSNHIQHVEEDVSHQPKPLAAGNDSPSPTNMHIEPLFLDDLSEASSSIISAGEGGIYYSSALGAGVQNVVEEAREDMLDVMDKKLAKLCDHLNVRFQFVENQYMRNNSYLHSINTKVAAINEYIYKYSYPNFKSLIEQFNVLADRLGELEEWDKTLLDPLHTAVEHYQQELHEFRDNIEDMLQFKVREAVLQVRQGEEQLVQVKSQGVLKDKLPVALNEQDIQERMTRYANTIFQPDCEAMEVSIFEAEQMQKQLRHYAGLFEDLYGQHMALNTRMKKIEEGTVRAPMPSRYVRTSSAGSAAGSPARTPKTPSGKMVFSDDLPATPMAKSPGMQRTAPFFHDESEMKQLREEVDLLKALVQIKLDKDISPSKTKPSKKGYTSSAHDSNMDEDSINTRQLPLLHVHDLTASSSMRPLNAANQHHSNKSLRFMDGTAADGVKDHPAPPSAPKSSNPLLQPSPRRNLVLSLDAAEDKKTVPAPSSSQHIDQTVASEAKKLSYQFTPLSTAIEPRVEDKDPEKRSVWYQPSMGSMLHSLDAQDRGRQRQRNDVAPNQ